MGWIVLGNGIPFRMGGGKQGQTYWLTRKPSGLSATVESDSVINLRWTDGADSCDGIKVYISTDNITFTLNGTANYGEEAYPVVNLTEATTYYFYLIAYTGTHDSEPTDTINTSTIYAPLHWFDAGEWVAKTGDTINSIRALTSNGLLVPVTEGKEPELIEDGVNLPVIRHVRATDDNLRYAFVSSLAQPNSIFISFKLRSVNVGAYCSIIDGIANDKRNLITITDGNVFGIFAGTLLASDVNNNTNDNVITGVFNGANSVLRLNGSVIKSGNVGVHPLSGIMAGNDYNYGGGADIDIKEILFYNELIEHPEYIENYLASRTLNDKIVIGVKVSLRSTIQLYKDVTYNFNPGTLGYFSRIYYYNGNYYLSPTKDEDSPNNLDALIIKTDGSTYDAIQTLIAGTSGDDDGHDLASIIVDDNGYIYGARQTADITGEIKIYKSDAPEDITAFTELQKITNDGLTTFVQGHPYPGFFKIGTDIFIIYRGIADPGDSADFYINKKGLTDGTFAAQNRLLLTGYKAYKVILRSESEDKAGIAIPLRKLKGTTLNYGQLGYIESTDGITWRNATGTFTKNIVVDGYITKLEYEANCLIEEYQDTAHFMATDGFIRNNIPYILVEEGTISDPEVRYQIDHTELSVRYYSGGWQKATIPASITGMPYTRNYGEVGRFHLSHDGTNFVLFVLNYVGNQIIKKYSSPDLITWDNGIYVTYHYVSSFGFYGTPQNRFDKLFVGEIGSVWSDIAMLGY